MMARFTWHDWLEDGSVVDGENDIGADIEETRTIKVPVDTDVTPLWKAAYLGKVDMVKMLLKKRANIEAKDSTYGRTPLWIAAESGQFEVMQVLLEKEAYIEARDTYNGRTPLWVAAELGREDTVKLLLQYGAEIDTKDVHHCTTPFWVAVQHGKKEVIPLLLSAGAQAHVGRVEVLVMYLAITRGHHSTIKLLAEHGVDITSVDFFGRTLLMGGKPIFDILPDTDNVPFINKQDHSGRSALTWAVILNESINTLLLHGAEINTTDLFDLSLLHWSASSVRTNKLSLCTTLLENKCYHINSTNINGWTPLHVAAKRGTSAIVSLLLEAGADPLITDKYGKTAKDLLSNNYIHKDETYQNNYHVTDILLNLQPYSCITEMHEPFSADPKTRDIRYKDTVDLIKQCRNNSTNRYAFYIFIILK